MNYIAELKYPGTFISHQDRDWIFRIQNLLFLLDSSLIDAVIALILFEQARNSGAEITKAKWQFKNEEISKIEHELDQINPVENFDFQAKQLQRERARILFMRKEIENGIFPENYRSRLVFIYAKSFLYSLDRIDKLFNVLKDEQGVSAGISLTHKKFVSSFPNLRSVRNSSAHIEDRIRGVVRNKPMPNGNSIELENLNNNSFSSIMEDGNIGEVEVSFESIISVRDCIQEVIDSFQWSGPPRLSPLY
jgi:hypothetical protein